MPTSRAASIITVMKGFRSARESRNASAGMNQFLIV